MAEAVGLAFGGIALTGLITTCVDILEYTSSARYWICDLSLALTKVALLKCRLKDLGDVSLMATTVGCDKSSDNHRALRHDFRCDTATQGLSGVKIVLEQTNRLCRRYSIGQMDEGKHCYTAHEWHDLQPYSLQDTQQLSQARLAALKPWRRLSRQMCWALQDKKKFDKLILDLDFLLSNTEQIFEKTPRCTPLACQLQNSKNSSEARSLDFQNNSSSDKSITSSTITQKPPSQSPMASKPSRSETKPSANTSERRYDFAAQPVDPNKSLVRFQASSSSAREMEAGAGKVSTDAPRDKFTKNNFTKGSGVSVQTEDEHGRQAPVLVDGNTFDDFSHISVGERDALASNPEVLRLQLELAKEQNKHRKYSKSGKGNRSRNQSGSNQVRELFKNDG